MASKNRIAPRKQPEFAAGRHRRSLDPGRFGEAHGGSRGDHRAPAGAVARFPPARARAGRVPPRAIARGGSTSAPASGRRRSVARRLATRSSGVDSDQQCQARAEPAAGEADCAAEGQRQRRPDQPAGPHARSPSTARSRNPRPAAECIGSPSRSARRARRRSACRWKSSSWSARLDQQRLAAASSARHPPRSLLHRRGASSVDCRSQSPSIAAVEPSRCAIDHARRPPSAIRASIRSNAACASSSGTVATAGSAPGRCRRPDRPAARRRRRSEGSSIRPRTG